MGTDDQLDLSNIAAAEAMARELQVQEERYADRVRIVDDADERELYAGVETSGNLCVMPELKSWVGERLKDQNLINKERRKAREERGFRRQGKNGGQK